MAVDTVMREVWEEEVVPAASQLAAILLDGRHRTPRVLRQLC